MRITKSIAENKVKKRLPLFIPLLRFTPYIGIVVGILLFVFQASLIAYSERVVGKFLMDFVQYETRGKYSIKYDKVKFNIFRKKLTLIDFNIEQDSVFKLSNSDKGGFDLEAALLSIEVNSLLEFAIYKRLQINALELIKPSFEIIQNSQTKATNDEKKENAIRTLESYLKEFKINELSIKNADLKFVNILPDSVGTIKITDITILIKELQVDNSIRSNAFFITENFEVEIRNEKFLILKDHELSFDRLWLSSKDSTLFVEGLQLIPGSSLKTSYEFDFPQISVKNIDLKQMIYRTNITAGTLDFGKGSIKINMVLDSNDKSPSKRLEIPDIHFGSIILNDTDIEYNFPIDQQLHTITFKGVDFLMSDLKVDSLHLQDPEILLDEIDLNLHIDQYYVELIKMHHNLLINDIDINFKKGFWNMDSISFQPLPGKKLGSYSIVSPGWRLNGIDFKSAFKTGLLAGDSLTLLQPVISIRMDRKSSSNSKFNFDPKNTYPLIRSVFPGLFLRSFNITNSIISVRKADNSQLFRGDHINLSLSNIRIDSLMEDTENQILGINAIKMGAENIVARPSNSTNVLTTNRLLFDSNSGDIQISKLSYTTKMKSLNHFTIDELRLVGLDWFRAINNKSIKIDSILLNNPKLISVIDTLQTPTVSASDASNALPIDSIQIGYFQLKTGTVDITTKTDGSKKLDSINTTINDFSFFRSGEEYQWDTRLMQFETGAFNSAILKNTHRISGEHIFLSKADSLFEIKNLRILPNGNLADNKYNINIPLLSITGLIPGQLFVSKKLSIKEIRLQEPRVDLLITSQNSTKFENKEKKSLVSSVLYQVEKFSIENGQFYTRYQNDSIQHQIATSRVNFTINNIEIDSTTEIDASLSFLDNFEFQSENVNYSGIKELDSAFITSININSNEHIQLSGIYAGVNSNNTKIEAAIPEFSVYGKDWLWNLLNKNYVFDSIVSIQPEINFYLPDSSSQKQNAKENLFNDTIWVTKIRLRNGKMTISQKNKTTQIPDFNLDVTRLNYYQNNPNNLYANNIDLHINNLKDLLSNDLNSLDIQSIYLSTSLGLVDIKGFQYEPKIPKLEYGYKVGKQTDWMFIQNNKIRISGFDFNKLVSKQVLNIQEVYIDSIDIQLFRDKNIPFPEDQIRYMPQKMIRDIPFPVTINNIILNQGKIQYEELAPGSSRSGFLDFTNLTAGIHNLTNDSVSLSKDTIMQISASTQLMGAGELQVGFEYDLIDPENGHTYIGHLGKMDLTKLNKMLVPNVNVQIKSGLLSKMDLRVTGNNDYTIGNMTMYYNDLHVKAINKKTDSKKGMGPAFVTFFANTFVINRNNPKFLIPRDGDIYSERDTSKSVFSYLAKTALSGVVSSIGARNNRKEIKKLNKEAKEIKDKKRIRRQKKEEKKRDKEEKKEDKKSLKAEGIKED